VLWRLVPETIPALPEGESHMDCRFKCIVALLLAAAIGSMALVSASSAIAGEGKGMNDARMDIIDVAVGPGMQEVTTLVTAVKAGGLVETLKGPGPFTVFAPTNDAFKKLPAGTLDSLLLPQNKAQLVGVLTFHVIPGKYDAAKVMQARSFKTAQGGELFVKEINGKWMVGNDKGWATIIRTDVPASNGVIHWIDAVVMP